MGEEEGVRESLEVDLGDWKRERKKRRGGEGRGREGRGGEERSSTT